MPPNPNRPDIPPNAGAVLTTAILNAVGRQFPSSQEKRGDEKLNEARDLVTEVRTHAPGDNLRAIENDLVVIEDRMTYAREMKVTMNTRSGVRNFLRAREYHKVADGVNRHVKYISDRVLDQNVFHAQPCTPSEVEDINSRVIKTALSLYKCLLSCKDAFPPSDTKGQWAVDVWKDACFRTEAHPNSLRQVQDEEFTCSNMEFLTDMKTMIKPFVDSSYGFNTSRAPDIIGQNVNLARALITKATFIYRVFKIGDHGYRPRYPYRHPIIQTVVNILWFQDKDDVGVVFHEYFDPIPLKVIALVAAVVECCIDGWSDGTYKESTWKEARHKMNYYAHLNSLLDINSHGPRYEGKDLLQQIQQDLLKAAREHAGVPPDPTTSSRRLSLGALNAAVYEDPPNYDQVPQIAVPGIRFPSACD